MSYGKMEQEMDTDQSLIFSNASVALVYCDEDGVKSKGKALNLLVLSTIQPSLSEHVPLGRSP